MSETLTPGAKYRVALEPTYATGTPSSVLRVGDVVTARTTDCEPDDVGDVRVTAPDGSLRWVRASALTPVEQTFAVGQRVRVADHAGTRADGGGYVNPDVFGQVVTVTNVSDEIVHVVSDRGLHQGIHPAHLAPVEQPKPAPAREPLTFAAAYEKAVAHLGAPSSAEDVTAAAKLAELLVEVSA